VLSSEEIRRKLSCAKNTATMLKRRIQVFLCDITPRIKQLIAEEIDAKCQNLELPEQGDLKPFLANIPVVSIDGHCLFSATARSKEEEPGGSIQG